MVQGSREATEQLGHGQIDLAISPPTGGINQEATTISQDRGITGPEITVHQTGLRSMTIQPCGDQWKQWLPVLRSQPPLSGKTQLGVKPELSERIAPAVTPSGGLGPKTDEAILIPAETTRPGRC